MSEDRIDLSPLDPTTDRERFDRIVTSISGEAARRLAARRVRATPFGQIASWRWPMLAAAATILVASVTVLSQVESPAPEAGLDGLAVAAGVPQGLAELIVSDGTPTLADLLTGLAGEAQ